MLTTFAAAIALSSANTKLALGALLALSEVLGADPRVKANGILSFILIQAKNFIKSKESK